MSIIRCRYLSMTLAVFLLLSVMMTRHVAYSQNSTGTNGTADAGAGGGDGSAAGAGASATTVAGTTVGSGGQALSLASAMVTYAVGVMLAFLS